MRYYPINIDISGKRCVVVGGGEVAARKVEVLVRAGAKVRVVSPELVPKLKELAEKDEIEHAQRPYRKGDLKGAFLAFIATDDETTNRKAASDAPPNTLVNVADRPGECNFTLPALVERGEVVIAISTGGQSPALARHIRETLEGVVGKEYGEMARILGAAREKRFKESGYSKASQEAFTKLVNSELINYLRAGDMDGVDRIFKSILGPGYSLKELGVLE